MTTTYKYHRLLESRNIRLLKLLPESEGPDLKCELVEASLDDKTLRFEALSYVWGSATDATFLECQDRCIAITSNCFDALWSLRYSKKPRMLWVDAVCIDQSSLSERSQQVSLMGDIYSTAHTVVAWLGPGQTFWGFRLQLLFIASSYALGLVLISVLYPILPQQLFLTLSTTWFENMWYGFDKSGARRHGK